MNPRSEQLVAYRKSKELFELVVEDMKALKPKEEIAEVISRQMASADAICSHIEEGFGLKTAEDFIIYLDFARGSAQTTQRRYLRLSHWMDDATVQHRTLLLEEIIQDLTSTISLLQEADNPGKQRTTSGDQGDRNRYGDN
jgi:four helix bundle protein